MNKDSPMRVSEWQKDKPETSPGDTPVAPPPVLRPASKAAADSSAGDNSDATGAAPVRAEEKWRQEKVRDCLDCRARARGGKVIL